MTKKDLKDRMAEAQLEEVVDFLLNDTDQHLQRYPKDRAVSELYQMLLRSAANLHTAERERHLGLITREDVSVVHAQVQQTLMFVLNQMPEQGWKAPAPQVTANPVNPVKPNNETSATASKPPDDDLVLIPGGSFKMGDEYGDLGDTSAPVHLRNVADFYLAKYTITQRQWRAVMAGENPSRFRGENLPVNGVDWEQVQIYLQRLNAQTGLQYRLPTEAEWEYAARGGQLSKGCKYAGSHLPDEVAWHNNNSARRPRPIDSKLPNELGLYGMSGNVWEWVEDDWQYSYHQKEGTPKDGKARIDTPRSDGRVIRGGSCLDDVKGCRVAFRTYKTVKNMHEDLIVGVRLAHDVL